LNPRFFLTWRMENQLSRVLIKNFPFTPYIITLINEKEI
jgi:hypothetical protein